MADLSNLPWSTSGQFVRARFSISGALKWYGAARAAALADPTDANLDRWGGAVDRVIAVPANTPAELAHKIRVMLVERRGGDGCLFAILDDLDGMSRAQNAAGGEAVGHA